MILILQPRVYLLIYFLQMDDSCFRYFSSSSSSATDANVVSELHPSPPPDKNKSSSSSSCNNVTEDHRPAGAADSEKQRRHEMKHLCTALSSLLPPQYLNGTRCLTDRLHEAGRYIASLQQEIEDLENKREDIKFSYNTDLDSEKLVASNDKQEFPWVSLRKTGTGHLQVIVDGVKRGTRISSLLDCIESSGGCVVTANIITSADLEFISIIFKVSDLTSQASDLLFRIQTIVRSSQAT